MSGRAWKALARAAAWLGPLFLVPIVLLALHRQGWLPRHPSVAYERTIILDLGLYWMFAAALLAAWRERRGLGRWVRERRGGLIVLVVTSLLGLVAVELALRWLRPETAERRFRTLPSAVFHHRNTPLANDSGAGRLPVRTNADGFRTAYDRESFLGHRHRIALLGDSFVYGLGVAAEQAVGGVLEESLRRHFGDDVAVLNTGAISYSPYLERTLFRELVVAYQPTLTLVLLDVNDIGDDYRYERENISGDPEKPRFDVPEPRGPGLCERLASCRASWPLWWRLGMPFELAGDLLGGALGQMLPDSIGGYDYYDFLIEIDGVVETNRFFVLRHPLSATRPHFERTLGYVDDLATDAAAIGSKFGLVVAPRYFHWDDTEVPENWEAGFYRVDEPHEDVYLEFFADVAPRVDYPVLSLLAAFRGATVRPLAFDSDPHWNPSGHRVAGEALAEWLLTSGLLRDDL